MAAETPSNRWRLHFEAHAPWAESDEITELRDYLSQLVMKFKEVSDSLKTRVFMALYCLSSSRLEGTLPKNVSDQKTFQVLIQGDMTSRKGDAWEQDGETEDNDEAVAQMFSHMRALDFVLQSAAQSGHAVTVDWIRDVHSLLMDGARDFEDGFRRKDEHVTAGSLDPPTPSNMATAVENEIVGPFMEAMADSSLNPLVVGCDVLCRTIALHPFRNGNGRLARLMFVYTMARFGVSVPVVFSSCQTSSRKHYIQALRYSDKAMRDKLKWLNTIALFSVCTKLNNVIRNAAIESAAE